MSESGFEIGVGDLARDDVQALIARHLRGMYDASPPESVHALGIEALRAPGVRFWTARLGDALVGCGALKHLDAANAELKSMRVHDAYLGRGFGHALLMHLEAQARAEGCTRLWLETGSTPPFAAALRLYERAGYQRCGPFADYVEDPFSVFMTKAIAPEALAWAR